MTGHLLEPTLADAWADAMRVESVGLANQRPVAHVKYQKDPVGWARDILGVPEHTLRWSLNPGYELHEWDGTPDPIATMLEAIANWESVGVESGTGTGKSYGLAILVLWFCACFEEARVFTFAAQKEQLQQYTWAEIGKFWPRFSAYFPTAELTDLRIRMIAGADDEDSWGARGRSAAVRAGEQVSARAAGMHARYLLILNEETQGIAPAVLEAQENTLTGPENVRASVGNPDNVHDGLHQACKSPGTRHIIASALDHPNVVTNNPHLIPGAVSRTSIERRALKYGKGSPMYESRVRGISAEQSTEALILREWVDRAVARYEARKAAGTLTGPGAIGVDCAQSENGDKASSAFYKGNALVALRSKACPNATDYGIEVHHAAVAGRVRPEHVGIDAIGVGAATFNAVRAGFGDDGVLVQGLQSGGAAIPNSAKSPDGSSYDWAEDANQFGNLRAQMWWQMREDLRCDRTDLCPVEGLAAQLTMPTYRVKNGKVYVQSKDELREKLGGKSPNDADAAVYGNWVRPRAPLEAEAAPPTLYEQVTGRKPPSGPHVADRDHAQFREAPATGPQPSDADLLADLRTPWAQAPGMSSTMDSLGDFF